jgi:hypothetical protein
MSENRGTEDFRRSAALLNELDDGVNRSPRPRRVSKSVKPAKLKERGLFGLEPGQAFLISALLFFFVLLAGFALMLFSGSMVVPV